MGLLRWLTVLVSVRSEHNRVFGGILQTPTQSVPKYWNWNLIFGSGHGNVGYRVWKWVTDSQFNSLQNVPIQL